MQSISAISSSAEDNRVIIQLNSGHACVNVNALDDKAKQETLIVRKMHKHTLVFTKTSEDIWLD